MRNRVKCPTCRKNLPKGKKKFCSIKCRQTHEAKPTRKKLIKQIDQARREYLIRRDADSRGYYRCISCGAVGDFMDVGHFFSRRSDFTTELGGDERNVNMQCVPDNNYKRGNPQGYAAGLVRKYGAGVLEELEKKKNTPKKWTISELEKVLSFYRGVDN